MQLAAPAEDDSIFVDRSDWLYRGVVALLERVVDLPHTGWVPMRIGWENDSWLIDAAVNDIDGPVVLRFADGSMHNAPAGGGDEPWPGSSDPDDRASDAAVDSGLALLDAMTGAEFAAT